MTNSIYTMEVTPNLQDFQIAVYHVLGTGLPKHIEKVITEKVVKPMREINCSVLGDTIHAEASVLEEVTKQTESDNMLSFADKYMGNAKGAKGAKSSGSKGMASTARIVPAPLSEAETATIQKYALETFKVLGCAGVCRIDFLMDAETKDIVSKYIGERPEG